MKAYTFSALEVLGDDTQILSAGPAELTVTFPDGVTALDYVLTGTPNSDQGNAIFLIEPQGISVDGTALGDVDVAPYAMELTLEGAEPTQLLVLQIDTDALYFIRLGGAPLPEVTSIEEFQSFISLAGEVENLDASPIVLEDIAALQGVEDLPDPDPGITLEGTAGADVLTGTADADTLRGGDGDDRLEGLGSGDELFGEGGNDGLLGGAGDDGLDGGDGDDVISASDGNDLVIGGAGNDFIGGGFGNDSIVGDDFGDTTGGNDTIGGGRGDDIILGGAGDDVIAGGAGNDLVDAGAGNDTVGLSYGDDTMVGEAGDDSLGGGFGMDAILGGAGRDSIGGGEGNDSIDGGRGADFLAGGGRDDFLLGDAGDDTINGGDGSDGVYGGDGADVFVWNSGDAGAVDVIYDFEDGLDTIRLAGVENAPGTGLQGKFDALDLTDTMVDGTEILVISYQDQEIHIVGRQAHEFGLDDFTFV